MSKHDFNYEPDKYAAALKSDMCARCKKELGRNYVAGNKKRSYTDETGFQCNIMSPEKNMYCDESCCEGDGAVVSDEFSF